MQILEKKMFIILVTSFIISVAFQQNKEINQDGISLNENFCFKEYLSNNELNENLDLYLIFIDINIDKSYQDSGFETEVNYLSKSILFFKINITKTNIDTEQLNEKKLNQMIEQSDPELLENAEISFSGYMNFNAILNESLKESKNIKGYDSPRQEMKESDLQNTFQLHDGIFLEEKIENIFISNTKQQSESKFFKNDNIKFNLELYKIDYQNQKNHFIKILCPKFFISFYNKYNNNNKYQINPFDKKFIPATKQENEMFREIYLKNISIQNQTFLQSLPKGSKIDGYKTIRKGGKKTSKTLSERKKIERKDKNNSKNYINTKEEEIDDEKLIVEKGEREIGFENPSINNNNNNLKGILKKQNEENKNEPKIKEKRVCFIEPNKNPLKTNSRDEEPENKDFEKVENQIAQENMHSNVNNDFQEQNVLHNNDNERGDEILNPDDSYGTENDNKEEEEIEYKIDNENDSDEKEKEELSKALKIDNENNGMNLMERDSKIEKSKCELKPLIEEENSEKPKIRIEKEIKEIKMPFKEKENKEFMKNSSKLNFDSEVERRDENDGNNEFNGNKKSYFKKFEKCHHFERNCYASDFEEDEHDIDIVDGREKSKGNVLVEKKLKNENILVKNKNNEKEKKIEKTGKKKNENFQIFVIFFVCFLVLMLIILVAKVCFNFMGKKEINLDRNNSW